MKRTLSLILALILCFGLGVGAMADEAKPTEEAETKPLVICIDPGHGARDCGACATYGGIEYEEAELVLKIALYLRAELETFEDVEVIMTRTDRQGELPTIDPKKITPRTDFAVAHGADVLISLHLNASENRDVRGAMVLSSNGFFRKEVADVGNGLGTNIVSALSQLGLQNRGLLKRNSNNYINPNGTVADYYAIVRDGIWQNIPSIIVEHCFLTNAADFKAYLSSDQKLHSLAMADAAGIAAYYGLQKKDGEEIKLIDYEGHWAERYIDTAIDKGWVKGYPDYTFRPDDTLTRADFVTLLSRLSGENMPEFGKSPFPDVQTGDYFCESVVWAVKSGIINGFEDGTFRPGESITREQMAHIMALYLKHKGLDTKYTGNGKNTGISDLKSIQSWAKDDVLFCYDNGLLNGRGDEFVPQGNATRAEACTILTRLEDYVSKTPKPTETPEPSESPEPTDSPKPDQSPAPTATPKPEESPVPTVTPKPEQSPAPTETPMPEQTPAPTATPKPEVTVEPQETSLPDPAKNAVD